jgi:SulP family sulfate permease
MAFRKVAQLAKANGFELVFAGVTDAVMSRLSLGGVVAADGTVRFEPDLDRGLERCENGLLSGEGDGASGSSGDALAGMPTGLSAYVSRETLAAGTVLIRQDEPPDDVFVLESGRLQVEMVTVEGTRMRLRTVLPGVVVGEIAMYAGIPRTADVVAETPSVVLRLSRASIERMEAAEPELAAALHRWLARTLSERLNDTLHAFDALFD